MLLTVLTAFAAGPPRPGELRMVLCKQMVALAGTHETSRMHHGGLRASCSAK